MSRHSEWNGRASGPEKVIFYATEYGSMQTNGYRFTRSWRSVNQNQCVYLALNRISAQKMLVKCWYKQFWCGVAKERIMSHYAQCSLHFFGFYHRTTLQVLRLVWLELYSAEVKHKNKVRTKESFCVLICCRT